MKRAIMGILLLFSLMFVGLMYQQYEISILEERIDDQNQWTEQMIDIVNHQQWGLEKLGVR